MIHVKVLRAEHLPVIKGTWKHKILCYSISSCRYYYNSFKNLTNTDNPEWGGEFDVDLFRSLHLKFYLFGSRLGCQHILIGKVDVPLQDILKTSNQKLITSPNTPISFDFPIKSGKPSNARLFLSFSYSAKIFYPLNMKKIEKSIIHIWASFDPPLKTDKVEIEIIQGYSFNNQKGLYYNFNKDTSWEAIGYSSNNNYIFGPTGETQIHSLIPERIEGKYEFFIINNMSYSGKITLNFIGEQRQKIKYFRNGGYYEPKGNHQQIGIIEKIDVICKPNIKYCVPFYLHYHKTHNHKNELEFAQFRAMKYKKSNQNNNNSIIDDYIFHKKIIEKVKTFIFEWKNVNFVRTNVLSQIQPISLNQIMKNLNLQPNTNLRVYVGGLTKTTYTDTSFIDFWTPEFIIYDKPTNTRQPEIPKELKTIPNIKIADNDPPFYGFKWHSRINLNLDKIGPEKDIVFAIYNSSYLETANPSGFFLISQVDGDKESLLFRCPVYTNGYHTHFEVFFRFEYINNEWFIIPMNYCFKKSVKMLATLDAMYKNNWILPESFANQINVPHSVSSKEKDEFTI